MKIIRFLFRFFLWFAIAFLTVSIVFWTYAALTNIGHNPDLFKQLEAVLWDALAIKFAVDSLKE